MGKTNNNDDDAKLDSRKLNNNTATATANSKKNITKSLQVAISGGCAGGIAKTIVAPIERIKLLLQVQQSSVSHKTFVHNKSSWQIASHIYHSQGILAFWRGNTANLYLQAGSSGLNFMFMDYYKSIASSLWNQYETTTKNNINNSSSSSSRTIVTSSFSAGLAGCTAATVLYPIQFLRTRLAADVTVNNPKNNLLGDTRRAISIIRNTLQVDGVRGIYQGYSVSLVGVFLFRSIHLGGYDAIRNLYLVDNNSSWTERLLVAQTLSLVAAVVCYPIDSVRRRLMMQAGSAAERKYNNARHAFVTIAKREGILGFYLGIGPNIIRSFGNALLLVAYDAFQNLFLSQHER